MISELAIISKRNEILLHDVSLSSQVTSPGIVEFCKKLKAQPDIPPHWIYERTHFYYVVRHKVRWACACTHELSPLHAVSFLNQWAQTTEDLIGSASESALRANSLLVSEIAQEMLIEGVIQLPVRDKIAPYVYSMPDARFATKKEALSSRLTQEKTTTSRLCIDIVETVEARLGPSGIDTQQTTGVLSVRGAGSTQGELRVRLNKGFAVQDLGTHLGPEDSLNVTEYKLHPSVRLLSSCSNELMFVPSASVVHLVNYSLPSNRELVPVSVKHKLQKLNDSSSMELEMQVCVDSPTSCAWMRVVLPIPCVRTAAVMHCTGPGQQSADFHKESSQLVWTMRKVAPKSQAEVLLQVDFDSSEFKFGPAALSFELSGTHSGLRVDAVKGGAAWARHVVVAGVYEYDFF